MTPAEIYAVLKAVGASQLYHANTIATSATFLQHRGLLSRGFVETNGLDQTPQFSDADDKKYGIWDRIFLDHVDIHHRGGRRKGPNQYGPVLFVLNLDTLHHLPPRTDIQVTKTNPVNWSSLSDRDRWYESPSELSANLSFGDFDKMLVVNIPSGKLDFPGGKASLFLDDPQRKLSSGVDSYAHGEKRLKTAASAGKLVVAIAAHDCRADCCCVKKYAAYDVRVFDSLFS